MRKDAKRASDKAYLPPGTLIHVGERRTETVSICVIEYDAESFREEYLSSVEDFVRLDGPRGKIWVNVEGLHDVGVIQKLGEVFGIHPLVQEDILNTSQRPKFEEYDGYVYFVFKVAVYGAGGTIGWEQASIVLGPDFLLSFNEKPADSFAAVRERLRSPKSRLRSLGSDYLAYALLDGAVDGYFKWAETAEDELESLEAELVVEPSREVLRKLNSMKGDLLLMRKSVRPLRELTGAFYRTDSQVVSGPTRAYLRDVYDHTLRIIETVETFREVQSSMLEIYLSSLSVKMNEVIKVLTIIATIFIPLTFIAGVYGMNFRFMPELGWKWAYPVVCLIMVGVAVLMVVFFKKKKWL